MGMMRRFLAGGVVLALAGPAWASGPIEITDAKDKQIVESFLKHVDNVPNQITADACKKKAADEPEGFTWEINPVAAMPLTAYEMTGDVKYLDMFVQVFDTMRSAMTTGPGGYLDWYGKPLPLFQDPAHPDLKVPVMITGYSTSAMIAHFVELVRAEPALKAKFGGKAAQYLDLAEHQLIRKWETGGPFGLAQGRPEEDRMGGNFVDLGHTGAIFRTETGLVEVKSSLTQPHNKHSIIINAYLQLYRVTGNDDYMKKAILIGTRYKHSLHLNNGHYEWNYWDPAGAWDVKPGSSNEWKEWIGPEHTGGYYNSTLSQAVRLYEFGVVFDKTDMERFVKTQVTECWNGSMDNPQWARVDGTRPERYTNGEYMCAGLAAFNDKVAEFCYGPRGQSERLKGLEHNWQGGPVARGWIAGKYIELPRMKGGVQADIEFGQKFLSKPENRAWYDALAFTVEPPGYVAPQTPSEMKNMPK
jgi:hypothetical protein